MFSDMHEKWEHELVEKTKKETAEKILRKGEEFYKMSYRKSNAIHRLAEWIKDTFGVEIKE